METSPLQSNGQPRTPDGMRIYAVGDIHGRADLLDELLRRIDVDRADGKAECLEIFLGDYIDRGPTSRQVIDRLWRRGTERKAIFISGNHETLLKEFLGNPRKLDDWQRLGGLETLISYGLRPRLNMNAADQARLAEDLRHMMPAEHASFLSHLKPSFLCGDYFFVHAGVRPGVALAEQVERDLFWIRDEFLLHEENFGKIIVHGHTPVPKPEVRPNRVNIDTGAYATGRLTCLRLEGESIGFL